MIEVALLSPGEVRGITARLNLLERQMATISEAMAKITAEVAEQRTVTDSVLAFINGLKAQLAAIQAELAAFGTVSAALDTLAADLDGQQAALAAAVATPGGGGSGPVVA